MSQQTIEIIKLWDCICLMSSLRQSEMSKEIGFITQQGLIRGYQSCWQLEKIAISKTTDNMLRTTWSQSYEENNLVSFILSSNFWLCQIIKWISNIVRRSSGASQIHQSSKRPQVSNVFNIHYCTNSIFGCSSHNIV